MTRPLPPGAGPAGATEPLGDRAGAPAGRAGRAGGGAYWTGMVVLVVGLATTVAALATRVTSLVQTVLLAAPLALVGLGLERLGKGVRRGSLRVVGGLLVLLAVAGPVVLSLSSPGAGVNVAVSAPVPAGADRAVLRAAPGGGRLQLGAGAAGLYDAQLRTPGPPTAQVSTTASTAVVDLRAPGEHGLLARNRGSDWSARLSTGLPWQIQLDGGSLTADLDLRDLDVRGVRVDAGVTRLAVRLGQPVGQVPVDLRLSAGLVDVYLPRAASLEIAVDGPAVNNFAAQALERTARGWQTRNAAGPGRFVVTVRVTAGRVRVHRS